ncbi:DUF397 domain-containing protein [Streptomyces sp. F63]|uniref:DUF397 domain-containing protein n=1 Tax=Streptomyces sp. F63 TaxID=2824887 RepID=UPI001B365535|nr:DUF397 domain-containing protein [Streptomyces sp. F63]MBQ0986404.1 DUF397 domain-containing protein [Streptomyces sp. F63]
MTGTGGGKRPGNRADDWENAAWRKSGRSAPGGNCVELAVLSGGRIAVRNSRYPEGPVLVWSREEMAAFLRGAKDGDFDALACGEQPA